MVKCKRKKVGYKYSALTEVNTLYLLLYSAQGRTVRPTVPTSSSRSNNDLKQEDIIRGEYKVGYKHSDLTENKYVLSITL